MFYMGLYLAIVVSVAVCPFGLGGLLDLSIPRGLLGYGVLNHGLPPLFGVLGPLLLGPFPSFARGWFWQLGEVVCREIQRTSGYVLYTLSLLCLSGW